jgi:CBS domain-containing protein
MKVLEIMTRQVITVNKETSLKEAAGIIAKFRIHGVPVVDDNNKIEGIITESDFFMKDNSNIYLPKFFEFIKKGSAFESKEINAKKLGKISKVKDIMTNECATVKSDLSVEQLVHKFQETRFNSLPVVDGEGALIGIVTIMDVIRLF